MGRDYLGGAGAAAGEEPLLGAAGIGGTCPLAPRGAAARPRRDVFWSVLFFLVLTSALAGGIYAAANQ